MTTRPSARLYPYDVIAVSSNAALDSYYVVPAWGAGVVNRAETVHHTAGGKGINFARAFHNLGGAVLSLGILGGHAGRFIAEELAREGIPHESVWTNQETRRSSTIIALDAMQTTVMLDSGNRIDAEDGEHLFHKVQAHLHDAPYLVLTGSLAPGLAAHFYADITRSAVASSKTAVCLDCSGEALQRSAHSGARIIKVNLEEYQASFPQPGGFHLEGVQKNFDALQAKGLEILIVTNGADGAYVFSAVSPPFQVKTQVDCWVSTAGAGDTFLAGLLISLGLGKGVDEAAAYASATASAALGQIVCGCLNLADIDGFLSRTQLFPIPK